MLTLSSPWWTINSLFAFVIVNRVDVYEGLQYCPFKTTSLPLCPQWAAISDIDTVFAIHVTSKREVIKSKLSFKKELQARSSSQVLKNMIAIFLFQGQHI